MRIAGKVITVTVALAAAAALSACSPSEQDSTKPPVTGPTGTPPSSSSTSAPSSTASSSTPASATGASTSAECKADDIKVDGAAGAKPTITIPTTCKPPSALVSKDITPGTGAAMTANSTITVHYTLATWTGKKIIQSSYDSGQPLSRPLSSLIPGWQQGMVGMKQGGRRLLILPPSLGYGPQGSPPDIQPNETLVFVVDALQVQG
jgi:peptidylprolyl isomerase